MGYEELDALLNDKTYQFDFKGTIGGYGVVSAKNEEEAKKKVQSGEYDDIIDTWDLEITEITSIEEN